APGWLRRLPVPRAPPGRRRPVPGLQRARPVPPCLSGLAAAAARHGLGVCLSVSLARRERRDAMKYAFTTLACPAWSIDQVVEAATNLGYDGVELRLLDGAVIDPVADRAKVEQALA